MTLPELLVGLTILAILGTAVVRLVISETRSVDRHMQQRAARAVARSSANFLLSELRMVEPEGGMIAADPTFVELFVPFALGMSCGPSGGATLVSLLPVDSVSFAEAGLAGYAWRGAGGRYTYVDSGASMTTVAASACSGAGITTLPGGAVVAVRPVAGVPNGTPVFLVQRLRYWLGPSRDVPGAVALFRTRVTDGATDELASPFDITSRVRYFRAGGDTSEAVPPAVLADVRGVELVLAGQSLRPRMGGTRPERSVQRTSIFFTNVAQ
jgi:hypothetical protein